MRILSTLLALFITLTLSSQILTPVKWKITAEHLEGDEFMFIYRADIDEGWTVYSQHVDEGGPVPTSIYYTNEDAFVKIGEAKELGKKKTGMDPIFQMEVTKFTSKRPFIIRQKVKALDYSAPVKGELEYMTCDAKRCLPPEFVEFTFDLNELKGGSESAGSIAAVSGTGDITDVKGGMLSPVTWDIKVVDKGGNYDLVYTATMEKGWNVYSQFTDDGGPLPTTITFEDPSGLTFQGKAKEEGHRKQGPDKLFDGVNVIKFLDDQPFTITQTVKVDDNTKVYPGYLSYMTCNDKTCLPPTDVEFAFDFKNLSSGLADASAVATPKDAPTDGIVLDQRIPSIVSSYADPKADCGGEVVEEDSGLLGIFIGGFLGGLIAILLPCIFPMIPITVSFFTKDTKRKGWVNGLIYGLSIIIIFVSIGLAVTALLGPDALNRLSTNWISNTLFFLIFVAFAISFFGYYEIALPSSWSTKSDQMADKGGLLGIFFMAFTLALVSFSCTGPIIGTALVQVASSGNYLGPFMVMFGFSSALALPFGLFAAFPSWLNSLPRSGGWMTTVKVVLGFLELALALKFLSVADMTNHWGFLKYELFLGLWILIAIGLLLYLMGFIRFPHDAPLKVKDIKPSRWLGILITAGIIVYLAMGFRINPDTGNYMTPKEISGITPPAHYNFFNPPPAVDKSIKAKYPSYTKCAQNINCFKDYYDGLAYAKEVNKPVFLDFTGHGCVNCRKVEDKIWVGDPIRNKLNNDFVLVSLYVDDDEKIEELTYAGKESNYKKMRNIGNKWADFQVTNFQQNSQPLYVMMTNDEKVIAKPIAFVPEFDEISEYNEYLECGLNAVK